MSLSSLPRSLLFLVVPMGWPDWAADWIELGGCQSIVSIVA